MKHEANGSARFSVVYSGKIRQRIEDLAAEAKSKGRSAAFAKALAQIIRKLESDPLDFGEPKNYLTNLKMTVHSAALGPLYVRFGVREDLGLVFLVKIEWLSADPP
jgi:hypothetical protein